jgi:hypothetical protein
VHLYPIFVGLFALLFELPGGESYCLRHTDCIFCKFNSWFDCTWLSGTWCIWGLQEYVWCCIWVFLSCINLTSDISAGANWVRKTEIGDVVWLLNGVTFVCPELANVSKRHDGTLSLSLLTQWVTNCIFHHFAQSKTFVVCYKVKFFKYIDQSGTEYYIPYTLISSVYFWLGL